MTDVTEAVEEPRRSSELNLRDCIRARFEPLGGVELEPHPPVTPEAPPTFES